MHTSLLFYFSVFSLWNRLRNATRVPTLLSYNSAQSKVHYIQLHNYDNIHKTLLSSRNLLSSKLIPHIGLFKRMLRIEVSIHMHAYRYVYILGKHRTTQNVFQFVATHLPQLSIRYLRLKSCGTLTKSYATHLERKQRDYLTLCSLLRCEPQRRQFLLVKQLHNHAIRPWHIKRNHYNFQSKSSQNMFLETAVSLVLDTLHFRIPKKKISKPSITLLNVLTKIRSQVTMICQ
jgi:hypothetical protein